jgi:hypothetical protein
MKATNRVHTSEKVEEKRRKSNTKNVILSGLFIPESPDLDPVQRNRAGQNISCNHQSSQKPNNFRNFFRVI